jgi:4-amino-4-deoxy-L-arabinose transferase-like glycosyltransferase
VTTPSSESAERPDAVTHPHAAVWGMLGVAVVLRVLWPFGSSPTQVDEGGWPLSVRRWAVEGIATYDFHVAPLYHLVLGAVFEVAPPTMMSARLFSVFLGLVCIWFVYDIATRMVADRRTGVWAALLWATCFPANEVAGRALIEPIQLFWILALLASLCRSGRWVLPGVAVLTAAALLTKVNALVVLPAFAAAVLWDGSPALRARRRDKLVGLLLGCAAAGVGYLALYLTDPELFVLGWREIALATEVVTPESALRIGRFAVDPRTIERGVEFLSGQAPFLFAFGVAGTVRALLTREALAAGLWITLLLPVLLLQAAQPPQYFSILYPALAIAAAALLAESLRGSSGRGRWAEALVLVIAVEGAARSAAAPVLLHAPERPTIAWLRAEVPREARVLAAPYILMQLPNPGAATFQVEAPGYAVDSASVARLRPDWIVMDTLEWRFYMRSARVDSTAVDAFLAQCCELMREDAAVRVHRVRGHATQR